jgi:hypothetical protein
MSGMFPDNQIIEIFGERVQWPGVDENGKFTNGSFTDPMVKPSFIPAETINLILNNLEEFIKKCNALPNSTTASQLADLITSQSLANKIIQRDSQGRAKVAAPVDADDIARKTEIDTHTSSTTAVHGATDAATANRIIIRDANGRAQVALPAFDDNSLLIAPTKWVRENFNPRTIGDLVAFAHIPTAAEMIRMRVLPLEGQVLPIFQYLDLFNKQWSPAIQESGDWWYRCTSNGTRDEEGNYFRVLDHQGVFVRPAGKNSKYRMADDAPYDGMSIGKHIGDAMRTMGGWFHFDDVGRAQLQGYADGAFQAKPYNYTAPAQSRGTIDVATSTIEFDPSFLGIPMDKEFRPGSISAYFTIKY